MEISRAWAGDSNDISMIKTDWEIERGCQYHANHFYFYLEVVGITLGISPCYGKRSLQTNKWFEHQLSFVFLKDAIYNSKDGHM